MKRPHPAKSCKFEAKIKDWKCQLKRNQQANNNTHDSPDKRGQDKQPYNFIVIKELLIFHKFTLLRFVYTVICLFNIVGIIIEQYSDRRGFVIIELTGFDGPNKSAQKNKRCEQTHPY
ncbi:MAG: hypothetical protein FD181_3046 [Prolixibacteraceae bacterium]|nr:MAG: hypothetical protein FD181_3046 [Prolixibacteraceae bacterium]